MIGCTLVAVVVANLLMTKPIATVFRPVFEPKLAWLFRAVESTSLRCRPASTAPSDPVTKS